ncbi:MAG: enoyl-CoA hydratase-related protein [Rhodothermia bacterium]|nr:MAG: enoyl-CoA hydratase-related protein [Rhodothermia bacterium]
MIVLEKSDRADIVTLTLKRPEKRNALNQQLVGELTSVVERLSSDETVRVIVLTGSGNTFSAGADLEALEQMQTASYEDNLEDSQKLANLFTSIRSCSQPVIARVNGHAIAGGFGLLIACDFAIVDDRARLGFTEVRIGFMPAIVMTFLRTRLPDLAVRDLLLTGRLISAQDALEFRLVNRVVDGARIDDAVRELADEIVRETSREAVSATKRMLFETEFMNMREALAIAVERNATTRKSTECQEGIRAFLEREDPPWKKKFESD